MSRLQRRYCCSKSYASESANPALQPSDAMPLLRDLFGLFRSEPDHPTARKPKPKPETRKPVRRQKTIVHPIVGEVTLSQSRRARRISLCVRPYGPVRLSYPYGVSTARALEFLESRIGWIQTARDRIAERLAQQPPRPTLSPEEELRRWEQLRSGGCTTVPRSGTRSANRSAIPFGNDPGHPLQMGLLQRAQRPVAEPVPDDAARTSAGFRHPPRTLPHRPPRPFAPLPCAARPAGRG